MSDWVLAIDFGSSNTAAAYRDPSGRCHEVRLSTDGFLMPSAVFRRGEQILVGRAAVQAALTAPEAFEASPKRRLADGSIMLDGDMVDATVLVAAVLADVIRRAQQTMGATADEVVMTHPDIWGEPMQQLLRGAALAAGIPDERIRLVSEATAAAWYYTATGQDLPAGSRLAVFDFGAGTCDVAVLDKHSDGTFRVMRADGLDGLGGHDLDARIYSWVRRQLAVDHPLLLAELDNPEAAAARLTLLDRIRDAKEALSEASSANIVISGTANKVLQLTRDEFEGLVGGDIGRAVSLTKHVLARADHERKLTDPVTIYLTGGSSAIPLVQDRLRPLGTIGRLGDPKTVVAQGALHTPTHSAEPQPETTNYVDDSADDELATAREPETETAATVTAETALPDEAGRFRGRALTAAGILLAGAAFLVVVPYTAYALQGHANHYLRGPWGAATVICWLLVAVTFGILARKVETGHAARNLAWLAAATAAVRAVLSLPAFLYFTGTDVITPIISTSSFGIIYRIVLLASTLALVAYGVAVVAERRALWAGLLILSGVANLAEQLLSFIDTEFGSPVDVTTQIVSIVSKVSAVCAGLVIVKRDKRGPRVSPS